VAVRARDRCVCVELIASTHARGGVVARGVDGMVVVDVDPQELRRRGPGVPRVRSYSEEACFAWLLPVRDGAVDQSRRFAHSGSHRRGKVAGA
jgi:ketosteroid isomerase-like protein